MEAVDPSTLAYKKWKMLGLSSFERDARKGAGVVVEALKTAGKTVGYRVPANARGLRLGATFGIAGQERMWPKREMGGMTLVSGPGLYLEVVFAEQLFPRCDNRTLAYLAVGRLDWLFREYILDEISAVERQEISMGPSLVGQDLQRWIGNGKDVNRLLPLRLPRRQSSARCVNWSSGDDLDDGYVLLELQQLARDIVPCLSRTCSCQVFVPVLLVLALLMTPIQRTFSFCGPPCVGADLKHDRNSTYQARLGLQLRTQVCWRLLAAV